MRKQLTCTEFIKRAKKVFNGDFSYDNFVYVNNYTKGLITCPVHGDFQQTPKNHLNGQGCARCSNNKKLDTASFVEKANYIHEQKYNYSQASYINSKSPVKIICVKHGIFEQRAGNHLNGQGCPTCKESKGEKLIRRWLVKNKLSFDSQYKIFGCKNKRSLIFDFAIFDDQKLMGLIEFQGIQHYSPIAKRGGEKQLKISQHRDKIKRAYCESHNIPLLEISYDEVTRANEILQEFVAKKQKLSQSTK